MGLDVPILVSSTPPGPGDPEVPPTPKFFDEPTLTWIGWTGDTWLIHGDRSGKTWIDQDGFGGILEPGVQHYRSEGSGDGARWLGYRTPPRSVTIPLYIWAESPGDLRVEDKRFRTTLRPDQLITLEVTEPAGARRRIKIRYDAGAEGKFSGSTYGKHWIRHDLELTAEDPFYYGDLITAGFDAIEGSDFYDGGNATPFIISSSRTIGSAKVKNPGDEPAYVVWSIHGAMDSFVGGWPGAVMNLPIELSGIQSLTVDTNPLEATIVDQAGTNRWPDVGEADISFAPLPPNAETSLGLTVTGTDENTHVSVAFYPKFRSAW